MSDRTLFDKMLQADVKLCECECGNPAPIATTNNRKYGWIKGQPVHFIQGHSSKKKRPSLPPPPDDESRYIALTRGQFAIVDNDDYERLSQYVWCLKVHSRSYARYAATRIAIGDGTYREVKMHRIVTDAQPNEQIDHIDGNGLNNRKCNLRMCTHSLNQANRSVSSNSTSGYKGVTKHKGMGRWIARITFNRDRISLGCFDTPEEAASAYNEKARELFGDFARLNIIPERTD